MESFGDKNRYIPIELLKGLESLVYTILARSDQLVSFCRKISKVSPVVEINMSGAMLSNEVYINNVMSLYGKVCTELKQIGIENTLFALQQKIHAYIMQLLILDKSFRLTIKSFCDNYLTEDSVFIPDLFSFEIELDKLISMSKYLTPIDDRTDNERAFDEWCRRNNR